MLSGITSLQWGHLPVNIKIKCIDESGNTVDPLLLNEIDYLSQFQHKCVVNKVYREMLAENRSGIIEVYQDKIIVKDN